MTATTPEDEALAQAERLVDSHALLPEQRELLLLAIGGMRQALVRAGASASDLGCVRLPLLVYGALRGDPTPALPLAAALTVFFAGIDLVDDMVDGDAGLPWSARHPADILLAALPLTTALPQLALAALDAPPERLLAMQRTLARAGLAMAAQQRRDLALAARRAVTTPAAEASLAGKSGEAFGMMAALAAQLAGGSGDEIAAFTSMGRALGVAWQLRSDCHDLFVAQASKDLVNGTCTLPLTLYLASLTVEERDKFSTLLEDARASEEARTLVQERLRAADILQQSALVVDLYCYRAHQALARVQAREPALGALRRLIDGSSILKSKPSLASQ